MVSRTLDLSGEIDSESADGIQSIVAEHADVPGDTFSGVDLERSHGMLGLTFHVHEDLDPSEWTARALTALAPILREFGKRDLLDLSGDWSLMVSQIVVDDEDVECHG